MQDRSAARASKRQALATFGAQGVCAVGRGSEYQPACVGRHGHVKKRPALPLSHWLSPTHYILVRGPLPTPLKSRTLSKSSSTVPERGIAKVVPSSSLNTMCGMVQIPLGAREGERPRPASVPAQPVHGGLHSAPARGGHGDGVHHSSGAGYHPSA